jgi:aldehyde dehydrogenase (NAD+)
MQASTLFKALGFDCSSQAGADLKAHSPRDGATIASLRTHTAQEAEAAIMNAQQAYEKRRVVPAPVRGELVRLLGEVLRENRAQLGQLVTLESGKILSEGTAKCTK